VDWANSFSLDAERLRGWFEREAGAGFGALREQATRLLQRERELAEVAELVGTESLQDGERLVLETARLLREGFLRQSAYDPADASCPPAKAFEMLRAFLDWHARAAEAVAAGVPLRGILDAGVAARLVQLARVSPGDVRSAADGLRAELAEALARLAAE
jgi:V/A-type H+-transporting ATPase subunit A